MESDPLFISYYVCMASVKNEIYSRSSYASIKSRPANKLPLTSLPPLASSLSKPGGRTHTCDSEHVSIYKGGIMIIKKEKKI